MRIVIAFHRLCGSASEVCPDQRILDAVRQFVAYITQK